MLYTVLLPGRQERADASNVWLVQRRGIFSELQVHAGSIYTGHGCRPISDGAGQRRRFLAGRCRWPLVETTGGDDHAREGGSEKSGGGGPDKPGPVNLEDCRENKSGEMKDVN